MTILLPLHPPSEKNSKCLQTVFEEMPVSFHCFSSDESPSPSKPCRSWAQSNCPGGCGGRKAVGPKIPVINVSQMLFPWGMCREIQAEPCPVLLQALASLCRELPSQPPSAGSD